MPESGMRVRQPQPLAAPAFPPGRSAERGVRGQNSVRDRGGRSGHAAPPSGKGRGFRPATRPAIAMPCDRRYREQGMGDDRPRENTSPVDDMP